MVLPLWLICVLLTSAVSGCEMLPEIMEKRKEVRDEIPGGGNTPLSGGADAEGTDAGATAAGGGEDGETDGEDGMPYRTEIVARHLQVPWAIDMAPDGRLFFTERVGRVRVISDGQLLEEPVISFSEPFVSRGEGGLLGLALDPNFADNHYLYVYHTYEENGVAKNRVLRLAEKDNKAAVDKVLLDGIPGSANHNGGRIKFGPDGNLYIAAGDMYEPPLAQDLSSLGGKILRIRPDGTIPQDNPFPGSPVYNFGHRNPQGFAWHPETGRMFASEHGQSARDELNLIEPGANYGWPEIEGDEINRQDPVMRPPLVHSGEETWAPSGIAFVTRGPWKGSLLMANLRGEQIIKFDIAENGGNVGMTKISFWFQDELGRIRDVYEGPDGSLYILTNNRDGRGRPQQEDDRILRLVPE